MVAEPNEDPASAAQPARRVLLFETLVRELLRIQRELQAQVERAVRDRLN